MTTFFVPTEPTANAAQEAIAEEFACFGDWSERYQYLIDLGRKLPVFPEQWKTGRNRLQGCQSMVWIVAEAVADANGTRLRFSAISDSAIVSGLIYLMLRVYSGRRVEEIVKTPPHFIDRIGLGHHLSSTRSNGLNALLGFIQAHAQAEAGKSTAATG